MSKTAKSQLYELIQQSQSSDCSPKLDFPTFDYVDDFDQSTNTHRMTCSATITIGDRNEVFVSDVYGNKKEANHDVCQKIYDCIVEQDVTKCSEMQSTTINSDDRQNTDCITIDRNLLILIDYENVSVSKEIDRLKRYLQRVKVRLPTDYDGYSDSNSDSDSESDSSHVTESIQVIKFAGHASSMKDTADVVVRSTRRDAVDHYIGYYLGIQIGSNPDLLNTHSIHILSRDRFASCLSDFCSSVTHNVDVDHLIESIEAMRID